MYRGCRRLVCSLVCVFSILSMLFLDTCTVEAATLSQTFTSSFRVNPSTQNVANIAPMTSGYISSTGSGNISSTLNITYWISDCSFHAKVPIDSFISASDFGISDYSYDKYYQFDIRLALCSVDTGTISNVFLTDGSGNLLCKNNGFWYVYNIGSGLDLYNSAYGLGNIPYKCFLEFDYSYESNVKKNFGSTGAQDDIVGDSFNCTCTFGLDFGFNETSKAVADTYIEKVSDENTTNAIKEGNEVAEDTNTKITDFFGSFFDNLLHIFVPEDGYFSEWFDKVNELLSDKLGMLYAPFDLVISTLQAIYSADSTETGIPFPGIKWEDTWLVEPFTFTFASLGDSFDDLRDKVYFATDTVLVLTFLMLLQSKVKLILEGHE